MNQPKHAFYSPTAAAHHGTSWYTHLDGREVEITSVDGVSATYEEAEAFYQWPDKVYLGLVTSYRFCGPRPRWPWQPRSVVSAADPYLAAFHRLSALTQAAALDRLIPA